MIVHVFTVEQGRHKMVVKSARCGVHILDKEVALQLGFINDVGKVTPGEVQGRDIQ